MVLSRLTKITGPGIATDTNWVGNNADFAGITTTATSFNIGVTTIHSNLIEAHNIKSTGIITATGGSFSGNVTAVDGTFTGNVSIAGTLTYEDVTNIDSVGIITAPAVDIDDFLDVGSNIKLGNAGVITATSFVGSGAALTGIDATAIKDSGGNVKVQAQASGAVYTGIHTFNSDIDVDGHTNLDNVSIAGVTTHNEDVWFKGATSGRDAYWDKSDNSLEFYDNAMAAFGTNSKATLRHSGTQFYISNTQGGLYLRNNNKNAILVTPTNQIWLYYNNVIKLTTETSGVNIVGTTTSTQLAITGVSTFTGAIDANGDLDVDGHTNLDNVSIAGVTTMSGNLTISNTAPVLKLVDTDNNSDFSIYGAAGVFNIYDETNSASRLTIASDGTITAIQGLVCSSTLTIPDSIIHSGDTNTKIRFPEADAVTIETNGSERFRINSSGAWGIGAAYGSSGQVLTSGGSGSSPSWTTITGTTINSNADNRIITGSGTANTLNGESNFTYDGNYLTLNNDADQEGILMTGGDVYHTLTFNANRNIQNYSLGDVRGKWNGTEVNRVRFNTGADTTNRDEGWITFWTKPSGGSIVERLRIGSDGQINIAGILTATTVTQRTSKFYGLTTTDRNALSPSEGDIIYNTTTNKHEFYTASSVWAPISAQAPEFDNASGSLATFYSESRSYVTPTSPTASGDAPLAYSISAGSLPSGMSINSSTGILSGTPNAVGSDTTSNFTVRVSNTGGAVERDYSITVKAPVTTNYSYTGSTVNWSKPDANVKRVLFRMWGGAGSHGTCTSNSHHPGAGGKTEGVINVTSHNNLYLQVGEAGGNTNSGPNGGWPNGGNGNISHSCKGSGGGGSSNIYHSSGTGSYTYIVAVAGGGGSVSHGNPNSNGGDGGGTNGGSSNRGGGGGTQNAGGSQGTTACGNTGNSGTGTRLQGGTAGTGSGCINAAAGGGGGWWGGGAGGNSNSGNTYGGGGGGSGYFDTSLVSSGATKRYGDSGWGDNRPSGIGGRASYGDNNRGGHGYITLIY